MMQFFDSLDGETDLEMVSDRNHYVLNYTFQVCCCYFIEVYFLPICDFQTYIPLSRTQAKKCEFYFVFSTRAQLC